MNTQERWKHAAEVAAWMAAGKEVQRRWTDGTWSEDDSPDLTALVNEGAEYRIKPVPVEFEGVTSPYQRPRDGRWMTMIVVDTALPMGTKVKVTVLES